MTEEDFRNRAVNRLLPVMWYGSSTMLVYTTGCGVHAFTYDPSLAYSACAVSVCASRRRATPAPSTKATTSNSPNGVKKYIKFCREEDKATQRPYTSRYIGSLVADFHRNLLKGGIYLPKHRQPPGRKTASLLYECNPNGIPAEQAGGKASDGKERILISCQKACTSAVRSSSATAIWWMTLNA